MDDYLEDNDFVSAIVENYAIVLKTLDFQTRALEELERMDKSHPFFNNHSIKDLYLLQEKTKQESADFDKDLASRKNNPIPTTNVQENGNSGDGGKIEEERESVYI